MIKTFGPTCRIDTMTREEYLAYYTGQQVEHASAMQGRRTYYANYALQAVDGGDPPWDSVAESYWPDVDALRAIMTSPEWMAARSDHLNGLIGRLMFTASETEFLNRYPSDHIAQGGRPIKYLAMLNRKDGMSRDEFRKYWFDRHVPLALQTPNLQRYKASITGISLNGDSLLRETADPAPFDGVVEMWFDDVDAFQGARADPIWERLRKDYYQGFAMGRMHLLVQENRIYGLD